VLASLAGSGRLSVNRVAGLVVVASLLVLVVGGGRAWATTGHTFAGQFGELGNGDGQFGEPAGYGPGGMAVMASTGEVFTADAAQANQPLQPRVQRFSADGVFASRFDLDRSVGFDGGVSGLAVDPRGLGAVYVALGFNGLPSVTKYSTTGVKELALDGGAGVALHGNPHVAVDPLDGTVYATATDTSTGALVIASFDPVTGLLTSSPPFDGSNGSPDGGFGSCGVSPGLAVDGAHRIYVLDGCKGEIDPLTGAPSGRVDRFSAAGAYEASLDLELQSPATLSAVAADPVSNEVYVAHSGPVGVRVTHLGTGGLGVVYAFDGRETTGARPGVMAVSGTGQVYLSDLTHPLVTRYSRFEGPTVVTGGTQPPGPRSVVLEGTIDPEGVASTYHFEYSTNLSFGSRTEELALVTGSDPVAASATVSGLRPNTTYNFRIVGSNASGSIAGLPGSFPTGPAPPELDGKPAFASAITPSSARLHGTVNPNSNFSVRWYVEFGTTTAYGSTAEAQNDAASDSCFLNCGGDDIPVIAPVSGLEPGTTYHFRLVAGSPGVFPLPDPQFGADRTFVTAPAVGGGATEVSSRRARLTGTIDPHGTATSYHFNYGPTSSYGASTPEVDAGSGDGEQQVVQNVSGLSPDTTYHVQVVATSAGGVVRSGADGLFRTAPAPTAAVTSPTGISTDSATLVGDINTFGLTGSYHFDVWSLDSAYAFSTPTRPVSGSAGAERVNAALSGLPDDETFVVQLTVDSNDSIGVSDMITFTTAAVPKVFPVQAGDPQALYGCASPRLDAYNRRPKPGETISITGQDLGVGGSVVLGDQPLQPVGWSAGGFQVVVPDDVSRTLGLTINCGHASNTIAVAVFKEPDNAFSIPARSVTGSTAVLRVRVPGPGKIESSAVNARAAKVTVKRAATATVRVKLTSAGKRALARAKGHALKVTVRVRFTPAGGRPATKAVTVTFKRGSGR
jgi:hypothetical protein